MKRLFIFAGYDKLGIIDESLLYYLHSLSKLGDIVFNMDNEASKEELDKVRAVPNLLHANAVRHGEYDFGSYKRGYVWAEENDILKNYDWVYLVNDSMYGPLRDLKPVLEEMESRGASAFGMIKLHSAESKDIVVRLSLYGYPQHVQSWFVGMKHEIASSDWMADFMKSIRSHENKMDIVFHYECGLSQAIKKHGYEIETYENEFDGLHVYSHPLELIKKGFPFLKKQAICNIKNFGKVAYKILPKDVREIIVLSVGRNKLERRHYDYVWRVRFLGIAFLMKMRRYDGVKEVYKIFGLPLIRVDHEKSA